MELEHIFDEAPSVPALGSYRQMVAEA
jgi:hypothetical protein